MFNELKLETKHNACFVAGTLINTDKGLVPIQDIKVGDRVLSKPENDPDSKLIYQPVTQIHKFTNKHIHLLHIAEKFDNQIEPIVNQIFSTPNHPFWKVGLGWVRADLLRNGDEVLLGNGKKGTIIDWSPVLKTSNIKEGWVASSFEGVGEINATNAGFLVNFKENTIDTPFKDYETWLTSEVAYFDHISSDLTGNTFEEWAYTDCVYNLTVEDTHTYFVGDTGIWVRDKS